MLVINDLSGLTSQKAKFIYGMLEKPFRNLYVKAERMPGLTGPNLMILLEFALVNFLLDFLFTPRTTGSISKDLHLLRIGLVCKGRAYARSYRTKPYDPS